MNSEKHIESLSKYQGSWGRLILGLMVFAPVFFLLMAVLNLISAHHLASSEGRDLIELIGLWFESIDPQIEYTYSGLFLLAMERLNTALLQIFIALIISIEASGMWERKKIDLKILKILREHGEV